MRSLELACADDPVGQRQLFRLRTGVRQPGEELVHQAQGHQGGENSSDQRDAEEQEGRHGVEHDEVLVGSRPAQVHDHGRQVQDPADKEECGQGDDRQLPAGDLGDDPLPETQGREDEGDEDREVVAVHIFWLFL